MTSPDRSGSTLGDYRIDQLLGRGGMGEVYRAFDLRRSRVVALKLLPSELAADAAFRDRFIRESRVAAALGDPHIVPIHDWGDIDGTLFIDMRLVEGSSLGDRLRRGTITPGEAVDVVGQIAGALDHAHAAGLVHRDVKPDNILVDGSGFAYLVDFGIARSEADTRLTQTGSMIGSIAYMAPERFDQGATGASVDQYSLACVLVECVTGRPPFGSGEIAVTMRGHLFDPPPRTGTGVDAAVARALEKDPARRFPTCRDFVDAARTGLTRTALHHAVAPPGPPPSPRLSGPAGPPLGPPPTRRNRSKVVAICAAAAVAASAIGVGGYLLTRGSGESRGPATAQSGSTDADTGTADGPTTTCTYPTAPTTASRTVPPPDAVQPTTGTPTLQLTTSTGDIEIRLDRAGAPCNVGAVIAVSQAGVVYDSQGCARSSDYILVCAAGGAGRYTPDIQADFPGPGWTSPNELPTDLPIAASKVDGLGRQQVTYPRGAVLITNPGAQNGRDVAAGSSSFFIVVRPIITAPLYTMIGDVISGMPVADAAVRSGFRPAFPGANFGMPNTMPNLVGSSVS